MDLQEESRLIHQIREGHREAYADLVRANQSKVMGLCLSLLGHRANAEDAAQEVFIKAYQSLPSFKEKSSFSTWIYRIAYNHCHDQLRKKGREKSQSLDAFLEDGGEESRFAVVSSPDPSKTLESAELVQKALSALSVEERAILMLREVEGLSYQEIAETLQCSLDAVKARLRRAREALEKEIRHFSGIPASK